MGVRLSRKDLSAKKFANDWDWEVLPICLRTGNSKLELGILCLAGFKGIGITTESTDATVWTTLKIARYHVPVDVSILYSLVLLCGFGVLLLGKRFYSKTGYSDRSYDKKGLGASAKGFHCKTSRIEHPPASKQGMTLEPTAQKRMKEKE
ncbi:hypothetical protein KQX54_005217 [Cotesia glomerata]|uniref:Uncharacterized protein n=1 Tax=Cotesia glomerata TaxID=32391 RepID=A0AAV7HZ93_COTGL|nr:hypothetical protein KQX54_005217 [Cotesia glomerata]